MTEWEEWLEEGDCAGTPNTGDQYWWYTRSRDVHKARIGARFYVVAHGRLRGYAHVQSVLHLEGGYSAIVRTGAAVAVTIPERIRGFRGLQERWWKRENEIPFPDWRTEGVTTEEQRRERAAQKQYDRKSAAAGERPTPPTLF